MTLEATTFEADSNEPVAMKNLIGQVMPIEVGPLNANGHSDYTWLKYDGTRKQVERKTWNELVGSIDKMEEQLQRHLNERPDDEHVFMFEGVGISTSKGVGTLEETKRPNVWVRKFEQRASLKGIYSWLYQIGKYVEIVTTASLRESSIMLVAMYEADQKEDHTTFYRHIKKLDFHPNPQVLALMGLTPGLGDKRASALIRVHGTVYNVLTASPQELMAVDGIGKVLATNMLKRIGRPDV